MTERRGKSLRQQFPRRHHIPLRLAANPGILPFALTLPPVTLFTLGGISGSTYSVITSIVKLARDGRERTVPARAFEGAQRPSGFRHSTAPNFVSPRKL